MFSYLCVKCLERASKPACGEDTKGSLGTWRCEIHGKCKVIRKKHKEAKP